MDKSKKLKLPRGAMPSFPADPFDVHAESLLVDLERVRGEIVVADRENLGCTEIQRHRKDG